MIQLVEIDIEQFRGIRNLKLEFNRESFGIQGPNGAGKSGVIDAIEFALTGDVSRLGGTGTKELSVKKHGPHVDYANKPQAAVVRLTVYLANLDETATITRTADAPAKPQILVRDPSTHTKVVEALDQVAKHPEIALTRREIVAFILATESERAERVQVLLRLSWIKKTRAALTKARNTCRGGAKAAKEALHASEESLKAHLQIADLEEPSILNAINKRRELLGLTTADKTLPANELADGLMASSAVVNKQSVLNDLAVLIKAAKDTDLVDALVDIQSHLEVLDDNPNLWKAVRSQSLLEAGLGLIEDELCPLCDHAWNDEQQLRTHLMEKLKKAKQASQHLDAIKQAATTASNKIDSVCSLATPLRRAAGRLELNSEEQALTDWTASLAEIRGYLRSVEGLCANRDQLGTTLFSPDVEDLLSKLEIQFQSLPDDESLNAARSFVSVAVERIQKWQQCQLDAEESAAASQLAQTTYDAFWDAARFVLESVYAKIEDSFIESYRFINRDDESSFVASLTPDEGKLDLKVEFHGRGLFHPGAYHSEGHQDGMGLCLYLALMRQQFGNEFRLVLLDDVVMSVDKVHRKQLCRLFKEEFPETQFIITTHDDAWFHQMCKAKLIKPGFGVRFRGWSVEDGPKVSTQTEVWDEVEKALEVDKVPEAAAALRRHLEFVATELADGLQAQVTFRADHDHSMGDLFPSVLKKFSKLLKQAKKVASAWGDTEAEASVVALESTFDSARHEADAESWAVNKAIHYNAWADFGKADFEDVVNAYKSLLDCMACSVCQQWLLPNTRQNPDAIRCECGRTNLNLKKPPRGHKPRRPAAVVDQDTKPRVQRELWNQEGETPGSNL